MVLSVSSSLLKIFLYHRESVRVTSMLSNQTGDLVAIRVASIVCSVG